MQSSDKTDRRPNLMIIVVDCLRADRCPVGTDDNRLGLKAWPKLRENGTVFTQAIASASWTPVSFGALLTGDYSFVHGIKTLRGPAMDPSVPTISKMLKEAGYLTCAFMTGPMLDVLGTDNGFDVYEHRPQDVFVHGEWGARFAKKFRRTCAQGEPWFALLHLFEVHLPRQTNGIPAKEHTVRQYDLAWQQLDWWMSGFLADVPENTLTVLTADHGESIVRRSDHTILGHLYRKLRENLGRPRRSNDWRRHGYHVFEELIRIPWAIAGPGVPKDTVVDDPVRQIDIAPTVLDVLGISDVPEMHGRSVAPLMRGEIMEEAMAYVETGCEDPLRDWHGLRKGGWKYAEHPRTGSNIELEPMLTNYRDDPDEKRNLIKKHPEIAIQMRRELDHLLSCNPEPRVAGQEIGEEDQRKLTKQLKALGYI